MTSSLRLPPSDASKPSTEAADSPEPSLLRNRRVHVVALIVVLCFGLALGLALGPLGSSPRRDSHADTKAAWQSWAARLRPSLASFDRDYARTGTALALNHQSAGRSDLERLAADARHLRGLADSSDPTVNHDLSTLAAAINEISAVGLAHWPSVDLTSFEAAIRRYTKASTAFVHVFASESAAISRSG